MEQAARRLGSCVVIASSCLTRRFHYGARFWPGLAKRAGAWKPGAVDLKQKTALARCWHLQNVEKCTLLPDDPELRLHFIAAQSSGVSAKKTVYATRRPVRGRWTFDFEVAIGNDNDRRSGHPFSGACIH